MVLYGTVREIRRSYSDHAVVVRGEGRFDGLPGVRSVETTNGEVKLVLESSATTEAVLRALARPPRGDRVVRAREPAARGHLREGGARGVGTRPGRERSSTVDEPVLSGGAR